MSSMQYNFGDVYKRVSEFLGWGATPTGTNLTRAKELVYRAYLDFLIPVHPTTGESYTWSFLKHPATLTLTSGEYIYLLPSNFDRILKEFVYSKDTMGPTLTKVDETSIHRMRNSVDIGTEPRYYCIRYTKHDDSMSQRQEVMVYPTPTDADTLHYSYLAIPEKPVNDADLFVGGAKEANVIMELALARAEIDEEDKAGVHAQNGSRLLSALIMADKPKVADTVGFVVDGNISHAPAFLRDSTLESAFGVELNWTRLSWPNWRS